MASDEMLRLSKLPSDIIRKIIVFGQDDIQSSRRISPRWNELAVQHLNCEDRRKFPEIDYYRCTTNFCWHITLDMRISARYAAYFGVDNWIREDIASENMIIVTRTFPECSNWLMDRISLLFSRCSWVVDLHVGLNVFHREIIQRSIENVIVDNLHCYGIGTLGNPMQAVLNVTKTNIVGRLTLSRCSVEAVCSGTFLMEAIQSVRVLELEDPDLGIYRLRNLLSTWEWTEKSRDRHLTVNGTFTTRTDAGKLVNIDVKWARD